MNDKNTIITINCTKTCNAESNVKLKKKIIASTPNKNNTKKPTFPLA